MQSNFYRSPAPAAAPVPPAEVSHPAPAPRQKRRGVVPLALFSSGLLILVLGLLGLRLFHLDWYFAPIPIDDWMEAGELDPEENYDFGGFFNYDGWEDEEVAETTLPQGPLDPDFQLELADAGTPLSYSEIYAKVLPSIVSIESTDGSAVYSGTGVILTGDGYILTNYHVLSGCSAATVTLYSGQEYEASMVGYDVESDLAVLKIAADSLPAAEFGDSDQLQVGDAVAAIGNPLGSELFGTMTDGIISAINREVNVDGYTMSLLQTSAALNPGNSGGALVNSSGQVVGITNMKMMSDYETIEGLGFAIPSSLVKEVAEILITQGRFTGRPTLGISCYALSEEQAADWDIAGGIYVASVTAGGPAEQAGLQPGDIITAVNGESMQTLDDLMALRDRAGVGGQLEMTVLRDGETLTLSLTLAEQADVS